MKLKTKERRARWGRVAASGLACACLVFPLWAISTSRGAPPVPAAQPFTNGLGMVFVPAPGTKVWFCVWLTRVRDYRQFVNQTGYEAGEEWTDPGFAQTGNHPVCEVSFDDAKAFCDWLTRTERAGGVLKTGQSYRLPTDGEWSWAAGPGKYPWGDTFPPPARTVNYGTNSTARVGFCKPNALGLFDLGGNLWEWCDDFYRKDLNREETRKEFPYLDNDGGGTKFRVLRGGSWMNTDPALLASSYRELGDPGRRDANYGFRCVLVRTSP